MPVSEGLLPIWNLIYDETVWVHAYWVTFNQLFAGPQDQLDLLDRSGGLCFYVIQDALATDIQLTLCKLSDPAKSGGNTNATVEHLFNEIKNLGTFCSRERLRELLETFTTACKPIRNARNKMIAHLDRATNLKTGRVKRVTSVSRVQVEQALSALRNFMNAAEELSGEAPTAYEHFLTGDKGGDNLIALLRMAERYEVLQEEGRIPWDDFPSA